MGNHCRELWIWSWVITKFERKEFLKMKFIGVDLGKYKGGIFDGENNKYYGWQRFLQSQPTFIRMLMKTE